MALLEALNHLLNFFAPAVGVAVIAALLAKLVWRTRLRSVSWRRLALAGVIVSAVVLVAGLAIFGRDGRIGTYLAMAFANALAMWWVGFARG